MFIQTQYNRIAKHKHTVVIVLLCIALIAIAVVHLATLTKFPPVFIDEPWYANVAWNWLTTGNNYDSIHAEARQAIVWPLIGNLPLLVSFATLGLGLFQARFVSWIFGVLLLGLTVVAGKQSYRVSTGLLGALLLAMSSPFLQASHYARPDIFLASMAMICYLLAQSAFKKNILWLHTLTGLLISLSVDIHQNAILFGLGIFALYILNYGRNVLRERGTWMFIAGGLLGLLYYGVLLLLPGTSAFVDYYRFSLSTTHQMPILSLDILELFKSLRAEIGRYHFFEHDLAFVLIGASIVFMVFRRLKADLALLVFTGTVFAGFVLIVGNKHDIYAILLYPFFMLMVSEALVSLFTQYKAYKPQQAFIGSLIGLVIFSGIIFQSRVLSSAMNYDYYAITNEIKRSIPPDSQVMGLPNWWLGLSDYDYRSNLSLTYAHFEKGYSLKEGMEALHPDYLIVDTGWQGLLVDEGYFDPNGFDVFKMPRQEFKDFLSQYGELVDEFSNPWHGNFSIYRIHWDG